MGFRITEFVLGAVEGEEPTPRWMGLHVIVPEAHLVSLVTECSKICENAFPAAPAARSLENLPQCGRLLVRCWAKA